jgi:hypothetical protein
MVATLTSTDLDNDHCPRCGRPMIEEEWSWGVPTQGRHKTLLLAELNAVAQDRGTNAAFRGILQRVYSELNRLTPQG